MTASRVLFHLVRQARTCISTLHTQHLSAWHATRQGQHPLSTGSGDEGDRESRTQPESGDGHAAKHTSTSLDAGSSPLPDHPDPSAASAASPNDDPASAADASTLEYPDVSPGDRQAALDALMPDLEAADPILATEAGIDLSKLKQAAKMGEIPPSVLEGYIELVKPQETEDPDAEPLSEFEVHLHGAVRDQYAQFGITANDLRLYLDVSLDIEDAISVGRKPEIEPERYKMYKRVHQLVMYGPEKSPEEAQRLEDMAEREILKMPWPTTMIREYQKSKGVKLKRMKKSEATTYDKGYLTEAMFPFEYEEDLEAAFTGQANKGAVRSFWGDEIAKDGTVERTAARAVGTADLATWGHAVWAAMQTQAESIAAAEGRGSEAAAVESQEGAGESTHDVGVDGAVAAAKEAVEANGEALSALLEAKLGQNMDLGGMDQDDVKQVNAEAAQAVAQAAFEEQEETILRGVGYERSQLPQFLEEVGLTNDEWRAWVEREVNQLVERLSTRQMDGRSPQDVFEDFIAGQRTVAPWFGVATDRRDVVAQHPYGPLSDYHTLPAHVTEDSNTRHPAATQELMRGLLASIEDSHVFPEIFSFTQTMWMHLGTKPYHPGNRRVKLQVHMADLQRRYGLSVEALQHILAVVGNRYDPNSGVLTLSCDRHRAREDNRRQTLHWMLNLIESALVAHPSDEWERLKDAQAQDIEALDQEAVPEYLQYLMPVPITGVRAAAAP